MQPIDVGVIADADEAWTRDDLLAAMHCEIPELITGPAQSCKKPKIVASTLVFESSPECIPQKRSWHHPDIVIGECIESIGDSNLHKPMPRSYTRPDNPNQLHRSVGLQVGYRLGMAAKMTGACSTLEITRRTFLCGKQVTFGSG